MIRSATESDAERLLEIYTYYVENTAISFELDTPSPDEFRKRISNTVKEASAIEPEPLSQC